MKKMVLIFVLLVFVDLKGHAGFGELEAAEQAVMSGYST
jgi:hypothetical protein